MEKYSKYSKYFKTDHPDYIEIRTDFLELNLTPEKFVKIIEYYNSLPHSSR